MTKSTEIGFLSCVFGSLSPLNCSAPMTVTLTEQTTTVELKEHVRKHMANNPF